METSSRLKISGEFDNIKQTKRLCVTGETRITVREHIVSKPFAWAEVRDLIPYLFLYIRRGWIKPEVYTLFKNHIFIKFAILISELIFGI
jgi:hypothetical protein